MLRIIENYIASVVLLTVHEFLLRQIENTVQSLLLRYVGGSMSQRRPEMASRDKRRLLTKFCCAKFCSQHTGRYLKRALSVDTWQKSWFFFYSISNPNRIVPLDSPRAKRVPAQCPSV